MSFPSDIKNKQKKNENEGKLVFLLLYSTKNIILKRQDRAESKCQNFFVFCIIDHHSFITKYYLSFFIVLYL